MYPANIWKLLLTQVTFMYSFRFALVIERFTFSLKGFSKPSDMSPKKDLSMIFLDIFYKNDIHIYSYLASIRKSV